MALARQINLLQLPFLLHVESGMESIIICHHPWNWLPVKWNWWPMVNLLSGKDGIRFDAREVMALHSYTSFGGHRVAGLFTSLIFVNQAF
jgi:hypothetical protein